MVGFLHVRGWKMGSGNIILTGMPASGKSTVGVILAKVLGYDFVDTDLLIQKKGQARLEEIIEERGIEGFLALESEVCCALDVSDTVIATGGSVVYGEKAMEHLKASGTVVYLKTGLEALKSRLSDMKQRGVVLKQGQSLEDLYNERTLLYERYADIIIDEGAAGLEETVKMLTDRLTARS